ncbi:MAG TPA: 2,3-bisphosphoglycerate-independent phosphoglycerate mutase [Patescibacteria group bacterium]|nr:2,3-bisphosphoglycerate-independent phosphoglycerate mutase [Patescibacteria group bacterium]
MTTKKQPVALLILDGWGLGDPNDSYNAIAQAKPARMEQLAAEYPVTALACSGEAVGLPNGQMGNSEVGHLNIGAGRVVYQELTRISKSIHDGDFFTNSVLGQVMEQAKAGGGALHLMGLLSDGGVHSHNTHLYALVAMAKTYGLERVYIHAFMDGRDTPPSSGAGYVAELEAELARTGVGKIATVSGRYYAMDRDKRWDRVEKAYAVLAYGEGVKAPDAATAMKQAYDQQQTDEFVLPTLVENSGFAGMAAGDGVIFFNFRPDRGRELTHVLTSPVFVGFERRTGRIPLHYATMTEYDETFSVPVAYPPNHPTGTLGEIFSKAGKTQLRIAETEKYAHVTYFFSGGEETPFKGEERILVPSPKVATYDLQPEMSAREVTDQAVAEIRAGKHDLIILNYANGDMVGHTGLLAAAIEAVRVVDECVGRIVDAVREQNGITMITADHGNADMMRDPVSGEPFTAHTTNPVPFILVSDRHRNCRLRPGILADIAPTILELTGLAPTAAMTGQSLLEKA